MNNEHLFRILAEAQTFYGENLWDEEIGAPARSYLENRGIDFDVARSFGLGYAQDSWDGLLDHFSPLTNEEYAPLGELGLIVLRESGQRNRPSSHDRFRNRLMFPIREHLSGSVVAFSGRLIGEGEPKYLNSPDGPTYSKGRTLFALDLAVSGITRTGRAIIVEGNLDCLMAHQYGFKETVATLGTALTLKQLALLKRHTLNVVLCFDGDEAGWKAAANVSELPDTLSGFLSVAVLPEGYDPDSFLREYGATEFGKVVDSAKAVGDIRSLGRDGQERKNAGLRP